MLVLVCIAGLSVLALADGAARGGEPMGRETASHEAVEQFRVTEQSLLDALTSGDRAVWDRVMDPSCIVTSEEGDLVNKQQFLDELAPLPKGLVGARMVRDLTVQMWPAFAVVHYFVDESESVCGQKVTAGYRVTNTYHRSGNRWKMIAAHLSIVAKDPPAQLVSAADWPKFVGTYQLKPDGWAFVVESRGGKLFGGRYPEQLRPLLPVTSNAFVLSGAQGEWIFVLERGKAVRIVNLRKFQPLVWTRLEIPKRDQEGREVSESRRPQPYP